jgi:hypothetical protein
VAALDEFWDLVERELLPAYLDDNAYRPGGFDKDVHAVGESDAEWFLAALRSGLVERLPRGELWLPGSPSRTTLFWEHEKAISPRPVTLFVEGLVTVATAARLHLIFSWPKWCLGFESSDEAFDLVGLLPRREHEWLAAEAKASAAGVEQLITMVKDCASKGAHDDCLKGKPTVLNAHRKWLGLVRSRAPVFFAFGPNRDWHVFEMTYGPSKRVVFKEASESALRCPVPLSAMTVRG